MKPEKCGNPKNIPEVRRWPVGLKHFCLLEFHFPYLAKYSAVL
jgi:hypothetical protein